MKSLKGQAAHTLRGVSRFDSCIEAFKCASRVFGGTWSPLIEYWSENPVVELDLFVRASVSHPTRATVRSVLASLAPPKNQSAIDANNAACYFGGMFSRAHPVKGRAEVSARTMTTDVRWAERRRAE
jgi:hypothetical protein